MRKKKQRPRALVSYINNLNIDLTTTKGKKHRLLQIQRYKKPLKVKDIPLTKNKEKTTYFLHKTAYGDRIEIFTYRNNPQKFFISLNGQFVGLKHFKWRELQSAFMKLGKNLGFLK